MTVHQLSHDEHDELLKLRAYKARQDERAKSALRLKVSTKGGVSLYGMGRWPVTLYRSQWERLFLAVDDIKAFIVDNADSLSSKDQD